MDNVSLAEDVPLLFRSILDRVADLEHAGDRRTAMRIRTEAIRVYSESWDVKGRDRLRSILGRADRALPARGAATEPEVRESATPA